MRFYMCVLSVQYRTFGNIYLIVVIDIIILELYEGL